MLWIVGLMNVRVSDIELGIKYPFQSLPGIFIVSKVGPETLKEVSRS